MTYLQDNLGDNQLEDSDSNLTGQPNPLTSFEGFVDLLIDLNIVNSTTENGGTLSDDDSKESFSDGSLLALPKPLTGELISSEDEISLVDALITWAELETPEQELDQAESEAGAVLGFHATPFNAGNPRTGVAPQVEHPAWGVFAKSWGVFRGGVSPPPPKLFKTREGVSPSHPQLFKRQISLLTLAPTCTSCHPADVYAPRDTTTEISCNTPEIEETEKEDPLLRLQNLVTDPEIAKCRHLVVELEQKLANLESQIYQPEKLIDLLLPLICELLRRKVSDSEEIALAIAPEIAAAIEQQIILERNAIANAIAPEMGTAIKQQITLERDVMVDALYPVIGSTIAKYMAEAISSINEKIENSLSPQGIMRKLRAKIQGVSEAELILKEAMPFAIRAIFLIHKGSGLVISEVQSGSQKLESEMLAGMLTAIRSFVNDCIAQSGSVSEIDAIEYGNSKIILEVAGYCYLAVAIEGETPQWFIRKVRQTLSTIIQRYGETIEQFDGDPATIPEQVNSLLEELTHTPTQAKGKSPPILVIIGSVVLSLILLPWGFFQYRHLINTRIETDTALALASTPELAVYRLSVNVERGNLKLSGMLPNQYLRHKAEQIAKAIAPNLKLDNKIVPVNVPPDPVLAAAQVKRVTHSLNQINSIAIKAKYAHGLVSVEGNVSDFTDAKKITQAFEQIPGVHSVSNTVELKTPLAAIRFYFDLNKADLKPADINYKIIPIKQFLNRHPDSHLKIIGHSASNSNFVDLALKRALAVQNALISQGIDPKRMHVVGKSIPQNSVGSNQPLWLSRYVEIEPINPL